MRHYRLNSTTFVHELGLQWLTELERIPGEPLPGLPRATSWIRLYHPKDSSQYYDLPERNLIEVD
jgi:hypothetical protein